jgi:hypothetical protein
MVDANPSQGVNGPSGPYGPVDHGGSSRLPPAASALPRTVGVGIARRDLSGKSPIQRVHKAEFSRARAAMQEIADWLTRLGLPEYAGAFAENGIDVSVLPHLTDQDLKDIPTNNSGKHTLSKIQLTPICTGLP